MENEQLIKDISNCIWKHTKNFNNKETRRLAAGGILTIVQGVRANSGDRNRAASTNKRYKTALEVFKEYDSEPISYVSLRFDDWLQKRLNASHNS